MVDIDLFDFVLLPFPQGWQKDEPEMIPDAALNMGSNVPEATLFNEANDAGSLTVKLYQFDTKDAQQQQHLLSSVYAETEPTELAPSVFCGLEELRGDDEGEDVAVTRWLLSVIRSTDKFTLLTFSYSAPLSTMSDDATTADIAAIELALAQAKW